MKISELIETLEQAKNQYGDISCAYEKYEKAWTYLVVKLGVCNKIPVILLSDNEGLYAKGSSDIKIVSIDENN